MPKQRKLVAAVIYNRLHEGMPLGIDATIRFATGNYDTAADRIGTGDRLALQHAHQRRPAAGADQQPRPGRDRGRRAPGQGRLPLLRDQAERLQRTRLRQDRSRIRSRRRRATNTAREANGGNSPTTLRGIAMPRLAVLGHPVGHSRSPAMQNAALAELGLAEEWTLRGDRRRARRTSRRGCGRWPAEGFAGANVTVPHKGAALAVADDGERDRARDRRRQHAELRRRRDPTPTTPTPAACSRRCPGSPAGRRALVLGAGGAARAVVWALVAARAPRSTSGTATASCGARRTSASELGGGRARSAEPDQADYELIVNTTAVGLTGEDPFEHLPLRRDGFASGPGRRRHGLRRRAEPRCSPPPRPPGPRPSTASRSSSSRARSRCRSGPAASPRSTSMRAAAALTRR